MITEGVILLRVQYLEEGCRRVAPEIHAHLVDLIQQKYRVLGTGLPHTLNDPARQGTHIGAAVPPDLGLIPDPTQGDADKFPLQGPGNGFGQGGFPHPRRAHQAQDGTLQFFGQLAYGQVFQDSFLHLFQPVVILVEDFLGLVEI